jgi:hypothetical protein
VKTLLDRKKNILLFLYWAYVTTSYSSRSAYCEKIIFLFLSYKNEEVVTFNNNDSVTAIYFFVYVVNVYVSEFSNIKYSLLTWSHQFGIKRVHKMFLQRSARQAVYGHLLFRVHIFNYGSVSLHLGSSIANL